MMRKAMRLLHEPRLAKVVTWRGDGLSLDAHVVVGVDGETGACRPTDSEMEKIMLLL